MVLNSNFKFECGKCKSETTRQYDLKGHSKYIHSDMFRLPSATIFIEIQLTTDYYKTGKDNNELKLDIIVHN